MGFKGSYPSVYGGDFLMFIYIWYDYRQFLHGERIASYYLRKSHRVEFGWYLQTLSEFYNVELGIYYVEFPHCLRGMGKQCKLCRCLDFSYENFIQCNVTNV